MIEFQARLKRWGRSFGLVVPMKKIETEGIDKDEILEIIITRKENPLKKHFGTHKFSRSTEEILHEGDRESWGE